jgi:predicted ATP-grasp superfamily ATP-dependent carboligase
VAVSRRVLVTDGEQRAALAATRSLGTAGHPVFTCSHRAPSISGASRFSRGEARTPDPLADPDGFVAAVAGLVARWRIDALLPVTEAALLALLPRQGELGGVLLPFPEAERFRAVSDKRAVLEAAAGVGIAVPWQWTLEDPGGAARIPAALPFPLVAKPSRSVGGEATARVKLGVRHAADRAALEAVLRELPPAAYPVLLQARIVGPGVGVFVLLWDDEVRAVFSHRRLREKPPAGGVSVYSESIVADPALVAAALALLRRFGWRGVAMVEFKVDARSGTPHLMEVNGRLWGSLQLAIDAGVDFPALLLAAASGEPARPQPPYRIGVRSRWWWGDVDHLLTRLRRSARELNLPPDAPGRARVLREFLVPWRPGDHPDTFRLTDPRPFLRETLEWLLRR